MKILFIFVGLAVFSSRSLSQTENFEEFTFDFFSDSSFQYQRIVFPLLFLSYNSIENREDSTVIERRSWKFVKYPFRNNEFTVQVYDNFQKQLRNTAERVIDVFA